MNIWRPLPLGFFKYMKSRSGQTGSIHHNKAGQIPAKLNCVHILRHDLYVSRFHSVNIFPFQIESYLNKVNWICGPPFAKSQQIVLMTWQQSSDENLLQTYQFRRCYIGWTPGHDLLGVAFFYINVKQSPTARISLSMGRWQGLTIYWQWKLFCGKIASLIIELSLWPSTLKWNSPPR